MTIEWLLAVAGFCFVTCFTPGPNNTMLMASGLNFGMRRTVPHLLGVAIGFAAMVFAVGFGIAGVFKTWPALYTTLKIVSIIYLLWLAWRIAMAGRVNADGGAGRPFTFIEAAAFQWVNPKAWIMAVGISATYLVAGQFWTSLGVVTLVFLIAGLCSSSTWALGGTGIRRLISSPFRVRVINMVLAVLLVASLWPAASELAREAGSLTGDFAHKVAPSA
jgi:threonine/homoserine/homoserine lactone efflux protein